MASTTAFRDINVHAAPTYYAFSSPTSPNAPTLVIDRPSGNVRLNDKQLLGGNRVSSISGILGIIKWRLNSYVIIITKSQIVGRLKGHQIYKVVSTEFLPMQERQIKHPDEDTSLEYLKTLLRTGPMYFSYSLDITNSFQRQAQSDQREPLWQRADNRFFWNRYISSTLIDFRQGKTSSLRATSNAQPAVDPYILPVMYGMMSITNTSVKGNALTFALITRRSRFRTGTRYMTRGIDEQGNVSNFNETEQTIILNDDASGGLTSYAGDQGFAKPKPVSGKETQVLAYVQTRGSVPVFWAEVNTLKYTPRLQVRGVETAANAARKHFDEQISTYGDNYLVNLVKQTGREVRIKDAYEQLVKILQTSPQERSEADSRTPEKFNVIESSDRRSWYDHLHYIYFDFHHETKGLKWHRTRLLLDQLSDGLVSGGYFHGIDTPSGGVDMRRKQTAVVRTNCMDCLDRTNVVQSMLGRETLTSMLQNVGVLRPGETAQDDQTFEHLFRNVWADNADVVSKTYSGTGALKTDFTRTGNRTRAGMLQDLNNSCTRYVCNNFADGPRQDAFDLFLGNYSPESTGLGGRLQFADRRPLIIQAVPYVLGLCVFFVGVSLSTSRLPDSTVWPLRAFTFLCLGVAGYAGRFMWNYGSLYVNWPKLNTPQWAVEAYQDTMDKVGKDPVVGALLGSGKTDSRLNILEEGKKRRE